VAEKNLEDEYSQTGGHSLTLYVGNRWEIVFLCRNIEWAKVLSQFGLGQVVSYCDRSDDLVVP